MEEVVGVPVSGGFFGEAYVTTEGGKKMFYKFAKTNAYSLIRKVEDRVLRGLVKSDPFRKHMNASMTPRGQLEKEVLTWGL